MKLLHGFTKGINIGGWLSQCCHTTDHYKTFITENDFRLISSWNLDHVRVPIDYNVIENDDGTEISENYSYIDNCLKWCRKYNLNLIIDLHKSYGYSFDMSRRNLTDFFHSQELQNRFYNIWGKLSRRYASQHENVAFELLNEVVDYNCADIWNDIADNAIQIIRQYSKEIKILVGGVCNNSCTTIPLLRKPHDSNIVFNFHFYDPLIFTHQGAYWIEEMDKSFRITYPNTKDEYLKNSIRYLQKGNEKNINDYPNNTIDYDYMESILKNAIEYAEKNDVSLYCGEYGVIDLADITSTLNWYKDFNRLLNNHNISRAAWSFKKMDFGIMDKRFDGVRNHIIKLL